MGRALRVHGPEIQYVGRLIKMAKRRVSWRFAFADDPTGEDHSVVLAHTVNSGKRVIWLNGNEIFSDEQVRDVSEGEPSPMRRGRRRVAPPSSGCYRPAGRGVLRPRAGTK